VPPVSMAMRIKRAFYLERAKRFTWKKNYPECE
jgi:hypothetical protein